MRRVLILGRGGAGKSTLARALSDRLQLPWIELDKVFWSPSLEPMDLSTWRSEQRRMCQEDAWILDGDLGRYDDVSVRLPYCDTIILLDLPLLTCASRAFRRSPERWDFWYGLMTWRRIERPNLRDAFKSYADSAKVIVLRSPSEIGAWLESIG